MLDAGFGLASATPLQRAVCRIAEGAPLEDLEDHPDVLEALGGVSVKPGKPKEILLLSGIRTGKSLMAAALGVWWSQKCNLDGVGAGEVARVSLVSLTKDLARVVYSHLESNMLRSPVLRKLLAEEPSSDAMMLRHPSGRLVEIKVVAGARAGSSLVARWCAGACFDEAPRMIGADDGVVNIEHAQTALRGRLLPGAQIISIGSPWAPYGPVYQQVAQFWGNPTQDLVVIKATGPKLNPYWWTEKRIRELQEKDETAYRTDVLAEFADAEESMYPMSVVRPCVRAAPAELPYSPQADYVAAIDPATRGDAWTLIILTRQQNIKRVACARSWQGSKLDPLKPREILGEIKKLLQSYSLDLCYTDQYAGDALRDIGDECGLMLSIEEWTQKSKTQAFMALRTEMSDGRVEIPDDPVLQKDLQLIKKRITATGVNVVLIKTPDGRHCDYGPPLAKCVTKFLEDEKELPPAQGSVEYAQYMQNKLEQQVVDEFDNKESKPWWADEP